MSSMLAWLKLAGRAPASVVSFIVLSFRRGRNAILRLVVNAELHAFAGPDRLGISDRPCFHVDVSLLDDEHRLLLRLCEKLRLIADRATGEDHRALPDIVRNTEGSIDAGDRFTCAAPQMHVRETFHRMV